MDDRAHPDISVFRERLPCDPGQLRGLRRRLAAWLEAAGVTGTASDDVVLATSEALANAVQHPGARATVDVHARLAGADLVVVVRNRGRWEVSAEPTDERGRGLLIMRALASGLDIDTGPRGTAVTLTFAGLPCRGLAAA